MLADSRGACGPGRAREEAGVAGCELRTGNEHLTLHSAGSAWTRVGRQEEFRRPPVRARKLSERAGTRRKR